MKFDFSNLVKNKNIIIPVVMMVIIFGGSYLGVKTLSDAVPAQTQAPSTTVPTIPTTIPTTVPTTEPTTESTTAPTTESTTVPTSAPDLMTTFPIGGETSTTVPTTVPTTTEPSTSNNFTMPSLQMPTAASTTKGSSSGGLLSGLKPNGVLFDDGLASYQYNKTGNYYYTNEDPWQRALGYNEVYDSLAAFTAIYIDTMRCKFRYDNKDWMIQFWKGQYGYVFIGHEIGVYYKPIDRTAEHYDCVSDEDSIYMEMNGMRNGEVLYHRDYGRYWWCTGFVPGKLKKFSDRSELTIDARMTMKDKDMLSAFVTSLEQNGMIKDKDYTVKGLDVYIVW